MKNRRALPLLVQKEGTTTQHNRTQHNTTQHSTTQHNTTQHNTTQHNTTQHNTTQHNTTQHNTGGGGGQSNGSCCLWTAQFVPAISRQSGPIRLAAPVGQPSSIKGRACAGKRRSLSNGTRIPTTAQCSQQSYEFSPVFSLPTMKPKRYMQSEGKQTSPAGNRLKSGPGTSPILKPHSFPSYQSDEAITLFSQTHTLSMLLNISVYPVV